MSAAKGLADMSDDDGVASSADAAADDEDWSSDCEHAMCRRALWTHYQWRRLRKATDLDNIAKHLQR